jgi:hypothetical protein
LRVNHNSTSPGVLTAFVVPNTKGTKIGIKKAALGGFSARKYKLPHGNTKKLF